VVPADAERCTRWRMNLPPLSHASPDAGITLHYAHVPVAQRIEHSPPKRGVAGSIPAGDAIIPVNGRLSESSTVTKTLYFPAFRSTYPSSVVRSSGPQGGVRRLSGKGSHLHARARAPRTPRRGKIARASGANPSRCGASRADSGSNCTRLCSRGAASIWRVTAGWREAAPSQSG
jgi:hypothetical protein